MAAERRRFCGEVAAWHASAVIAFMPFTARSLDPNGINPYRRRSDALARVERWQARRRMRLVVDKKREQGRR